MSEDETFCLFVFSELLASWFNNIQVLYLLYVLRIFRGHFIIWTEKQHYFEYHIF